MADPAPIPDDAAERLERLSEEVESSQEFDVFNTLVAPVQVSEFFHENPWILPLALEAMAVRKTPEGGRWPEWLRPYAILQRDRGQDDAINAAVVVGAPADHTRDSLRAAILAELGRE